MPEIIAVTDSTSSSDYESVSSDSPTSDTNNITEESGMATPTSHSFAPPPPPPDQRAPPSSDPNFAAIPLLHIPSAEPSPAEPSPHPASPRKRPHKLSSSSNPEAGWDVDTPTNGMVLQYGTSNEVERRKQRDNIYSELKVLTESSIQI